MKKIGFIDYFIDEWHANNYPDWMKASALGKDFEIAYVWAELDKSPITGVSTDEWCEKFGVKKCRSIEEVCEKSDYVLILVPGYPDKHEEYAKVALKYGKPTYIDKTFAPDLATAKRIFDMADEYGAPVFTSSALRYSTELDEYVGKKSVTAKGAGSSIHEYIVHIAEMLVKTIGVGATSILATEDGGYYTFDVEYADGRVGKMIYEKDQPYEIGCCCKSTAIESNFFQALIDDILRFYSEPTPSFAREETLEVMKLREGAIKAAEALGEKITF